MKAFLKAFILVLFFAGLFISATDAQKYYAGASVNGKWGFIDTKGNWVIKPEFDEVQNFSEGMSCAKKGNKWGFIALSGELSLIHI